MITVSQCVTWFFFAFKQEYKMKKKTKFIGLTHLKAGAQKNIVCGPEKKHHFIEPE